jgi:glycine/D-amino acid oxidase-like deaminating enzyme
MRRSPAYNLAVIGGGIIGAWTLYLATNRNPRWRCALIEKSVIGGGATLHSAGVSLATGRTPRQRALAERSTLLYSQVEASLRLVKHQASACWLMAAEALGAAAVPSRRA